MKRIIALFRPDPTMQFHFGRAIVAIAVAGGVATLGIAISAIVKQGFDHAIPLLDDMVGVAVVATALIAIFGCIPWIILHYFRFTGPLTAASCGFLIAVVFAVLEAPRAFDKSVLIITGIAVGLTLWRITYRSSEPKIDPSVFE